MNWTPYIIGLALVVLPLVALAASIGMAVHERASLRDHGPDCFWCHPRLLPRR